LHAGKTTDGHPYGCLDLISKLRQISVGLSLGVSARKNPSFWLAFLRVFEATEE
jgi:hypothetical protein